MLTLYHIMLFLQVITRFICSSSPVIYWISADVILHSLVQLQSAAILDPKIYSFKEMTKRILKIIFCLSNHSNNWHVKLILGFFLLYAFLGYIFHCNFYPWT